MTVDAHHIISLSLRKIQGSRSRRGGPDLCKNLLVSNVLHKAKNVFIQKQKSVDDDDEDEDADEVDDDVDDNEDRSFEDDDDQCPLSDDEDDSSQEAYMDGELDDDPNHPPSQVPPQNRLHLLPPDDTLLDSEDAVTPDGVVRNLQTDYLTSTTFSPLDEEDSSSSSSSGDSLEDEDEDGNEDHPRSFPRIFHSSTLIDPSSVLVSVYNDPSLHPGICSDSAATLFVHDSSDADVATTDSDATSCPHFYQPCQCQKQQLQVHPHVHLQPSEQQQQHRQQHSVVVDKEGFDQHAVLQPIASLMIDHPSSWTSMKRRRTSSDGSDDLFEAAADENIEDSLQKEKRLRLDTTYECGYYSRVSDYNNVDAEASSSRVVYDDSVSISQQPESSTESSSQHQSHQERTNASSLHLLSSMIPSETLSVDEYDQQHHQSQQHHQRHIHMNGVPSVHSIAGKLLEGSDAPPRNMASMLTPLKCVAPTQPSPSNNAVLNQGYGGNVSGEKIGESWKDGNETLRLQQARNDKDQHHSLPQQPDSGAQITSLVSRFSSGFSGLAVVSRQQQLHNSLAAASELEAVVAGQPQQQGGNGPEISSVSICSALIKESFDVLSRPSLLAMSV